MWGRIGGSGERPQVRGLQAADRARQGPHARTPTDLVTPKDKVDVYTFGRQLLAANDLDPVYAVLWKAGLEPDLLQHWLVAYFCFYHVGTASWVVDQKDYWTAMEKAAGSKEWPRSSERRHFRGRAALNSVEWLQEQGVPALFEGLMSWESQPVPAEEVIAVAQTWKGFGPWIAFKVADMLNALGLVQVVFDVGTAMYKGSPTEATAVLRDWEQPGWEPDSQEELSTWAVGRVLEELKGETAPPQNDRPLEPQEAETILCKWFSYLKGHYHVGEDVTSVKKGLLRFARCKTSQRLLSAGKAGGLWWK